MPHIHEKIDFTVAIFVVHEAKVLVVHHRALDRWLPLGGHIELDEEDVVRHRLVKAIIKAYDREKDANEEVHPKTRRPWQRKDPEVGNA